MRAIATRCRMPPESSCGYFSASLSTFKPTRWIHWRPSSSRTLRGDAMALQAKRHVVQHRAVVETRVVLKHHAAVRTRTPHRLAQHQDLAQRGRMLRLEPRDQPQDRALAATARSENANELTLVRLVLHDKRHVPNGRERVRPIDIVGLGHVPELDHVRPLGLGALAHVVQHTTKPHVGAGDRFRWFLFGGFVGVGHVGVS